jgi:hypothetical protein
MGFLNKVMVVSSQRTNNDIKKEVIKLILTGKYPVVGIRYEEKKRSVGEICEDSKDNPDRDDSRDFPAYESDEYNELPSMGGTSAWLIYHEERQLVTPDYNDEDDIEDILDDLIWDNLPDGESDSEHIYIVGGKSGETREDYDVNEVVIKNAKVLFVVK